MYFSSTTDKNGVLQQIERRTNLGDTAITGNALLLAHFTMEVDNAYSRVANLIYQADRRIQWDDPNFANAPVSVFNLVANQQNYGIFAESPSSIQDWLQIERVEILDNNDNGVLLDPIDIADIDEAMSEYESTAGIPKEYDLRSTEIFLYPKPSYNKTSGGIVYFKRAPEYFTTTSGTKQPGFATLFHELLVLWPVNNWKVDHGQDNSAIRNEITIMEKDLVEFYAKRAKYERPRMTVLSQNNK